MMELNMAFKYNPEISLGTIAEILSLMLLSAGAYAVLAANDARHDQRLDGHDKDIARIQKQQDDSNATLHAEVKSVAGDVKEINNKVTQIIIDNARQSQPRRVQ